MMLLRENLKIQHFPFSPSFELRVALLRLTVGAWQMIGSDSDCGPPAEIGVS